MIKRFMNLFRGSERSHGVWYPSTGGMQTAKKPAGEKEFAAHLEGKVGLGMPMLMDNGKVFFGAIDIDVKGVEEIDVASISRKIEEMELPLVACQSKSKGAHLYLFLDPPASASSVQKSLTRWAGALGYGKSEIFPKQVKLQGDGFSSWINLPYFGNARVAYLNGMPVSLEQFIELAQSRIQNQDSMMEMILDEESSADAPPCLLTMVSNGVGEGHRNDALFNLAIYYKRSAPDNWSGKLTEFNYTRVKPPLPQAELTAMIKQLSGIKEYNYKCSTEPIASYCVKDACLGRRYGLKARGDEKKTFEFGELKKILTNPPRWILSVNGKEVEMSTKEFMNYDLAREAILERADVILPPMKKEEWHASMRTRVSTKTDIEAPDDASVGGVIRSRLFEFMHRAIGGVNSEDKLITGKRSDLMRGMPVVLYGALELQTIKDKNESVMTNVTSEKKGEPFVFFKGPDFVDYLKRRKSEEAKGQMLWSILRQHGCGHARIRVGGGQCQVWYRAVEFSLMGVEEIDNPIDGVEDEF